MIQLEDEENILVKTPYSFQYKLLDIYQRLNITTTDETII